MVRFIYMFWQHAFSGPKSINLNKFLLNLAIRGLGVSNYSTDYLSGEYAWMKSYLSESKKMRVVFDVGANVGKYTKNVIATNKNCTVYAFEPHPFTFENLKKNLVAYDVKGTGCRVNLFNKAVGDTPGILPLYDRCDRDGSSHATLYNAVIKDIHQVESIIHSVNVITLDDFCKEHKIEHIDLLKIDTEGNELNCLKGANRLIDSGAIAAIQFEFSEMNILSHATFKDFWNLLSGYHFARLLPGGRLFPIKKYSSLMCEIYEYQNFVALKK